MKSDHQLHRNLDLLLLCVTFLFCPGAAVQCQDSAASSAENFYTRSLHFTNQGIRSVYSKEHGGLEQLTGMPATEMGCDKPECHARTCDVCHKKTVGGKDVYTSEPAVATAACTNCHGDLAKDNPDVHFTKGMKCMDCHTTREIHGDGTAAESYLQAGFFDVRCEGCHAQISTSTSHTVHGGRLACTVCHVREISTCYNCHIDTRIRKEKGSSISLSGMNFLINHAGKVKLANFLSYVYKDKTMLTFAPTFPHNVVKAGRACGECHGTTLVRDIGSGSFAPVSWENDSLHNIRGVSPVYNVGQWKMVFLTKENSRWIPLPDAAEPIVHFSGNCTPMTADQMSKLGKTQGGKK